MFILFSNLISIILTITPEWDLTTSGKDLLLFNNTYEYTVYSKIFNDLHETKFKMIKRIIRYNGIINETNIIFFGDDIIGKEVPFDNIQSTHFVHNKYIICPYGKYHPYDIEEGKFSIPEGAVADDDWDLKCAWHLESQTFFAGYARKHDYNLFFINDFKFIWDSVNFSGELFDFKINNKKTGAITDKIPNIYYYKFDKKLFFSDSVITINKKRKSNPINPHYIMNIELSKIKGFMKNNTNDFYFVAYNDSKMFYTGYINTIVDDDFHFINHTLIFNNKTSPFNFSDDVEIQEINFILRNKFIYYKLRIKSINTFYHGIIDIELNQVIFNTKERINKFIPYSDKAMLAITPKTAYIICAYNSEGNCTDYCPEGYIIDSSGNTCGFPCPDGKYKFISNNTCIETCNISIYIKRGSKCGLCKDFDKDKPYKFINGTKCYSSIPEGAIIYNNNSKLMICNKNKNYYFENDICHKKFNCHETCEECEEESLSEINQHCTKCKENYVLQNGNCLDKCSNGYYLTESKYQECKKNYCNIFSINSCDCLECKNGLYLDKQKKICEKCNEHCKTCVQGGEENNEHCSSCDINSQYKYLLDAKGFSKNCVHECPNGTILENEKCILNNKEQELEINNNNKNIKNYSSIIISTSVVGCIFTVAIILIVYFSRKRKKKNIIDDEDKNELMKNMGAEMEEL